MRNLRAQEPPRDIPGELLEWALTYFIVVTAGGIVWLIAEWVS